MCKHFGLSHTHNARAGSLVEAAAADDACRCRLGKQVRQTASACNEANEAEILLLTGITIHLMF